jgi:hypothetical protein
MPFKRADKPSIRDIRRMFYSIRPSAPFGGCRRVGIRLYAHYFRRIWSWIIFGAGMHCVTCNNIADMAAAIAVVTSRLFHKFPNVLLCIMYVIRKNVLVRILLAPIAFAVIGVPYSIAATPVALGVFRDGSTQETDVFSRWLGNEVKVGASFFDSQNWAQMEDIGKFQYWAAWVNARPGRMVTFGVPMFPSGTPGSLAACANGDYNQHWANIANNIVSARLKNADLRMGWEFNGNWFIWSNIGKEADFASCFRNVVTSMCQSASKS